MAVEEPKLNLYRKIILKSSAKSSPEASSNAIENLDLNQISSNIQDEPKLVPLENKTTIRLDEVVKDKNGIVEEKSAEEKSNKNNKKKDFEEILKTSDKKEKTEVNGKHKEKRKKSRSPSRSRKKVKSKSKERKKSRSRSKSRKDKKSKKSSSQKKDSKHKKKSSRKRSKSRDRKKKSSFSIDNIIQDRKMNKIVDIKRLTELAKMDIKEKNDPNYVHIFQVPAIPQPKLTFKRPIEKSIDGFVEFCKNLAKDNSNEDEVNYLNNLQTQIETVKKESVYLSNSESNVFNYDINKKVNDVIAKLFPVSSGTKHRIVTEVNNDQIDDKVYQNTHETVGEDNSLAVDPFFKKVSPEHSKEIVLPNLGKYTGFSDANFLTPEELEGEYKAWTRKDLLKTAAPITDSIGKKLLEKMGWKEGTGLGKNREGPVEPIKLDVKLNRKGLEAEGFVKERTQKQIEGKHPVSCLLELCKAKKWSDPIYETVEESGPSHQRNFLMKVILNNVTYQPSGPSSNKKLAKAMAAYVCLQALGIQCSIPT
ncbi:unnamed protein product [Brachionus calyciflorus]|uniref:SON n=1 Tax=Brachionus calyciflorus TaxID=104777 RepID=A0A813M3F1_9BILA|nr:unnamed protein product [Brachionus calyciflorus]